MESSPNHLREKDSFPDLSLSFEVGFKLGNASQHIEGICKKYHASICMKSSSFFFNIHLKPIWRFQLRNVFTYVTNPPGFWAWRISPRQIVTPSLVCITTFNISCTMTPVCGTWKKPTKTVAILFFGGLNPSDFWGKWDLRENLSELCGRFFFRWWILHHFRIHNSI